MLALLLTLTERPMAGHALVYSPREKAVLAVGGDAAGAMPLMRLNGGTWMPIKNSELSARSLAAVANDSEGNILVHGGAVGTAKPGGGIDFKVTADTWLWNGEKWRRVATEGPSPRDHHAMAYDADRRRFVLFGGSDAHPDGRADYFGDTWEWDGKAWTKVATNGPPARCHFAMAYDPVRQRTILVGGYGPNGPDGKTWAWDGQVWKAAAEGAPAWRSSPRLAWDPKGDRLLLFGGESQNILPKDLWSWDGKAWSVVTKAGPDGRTVHGLAFDPIRGVLIGYGGAAGNDVLGDVWEFKDGSWRRASRAG